jgi:hypothetical protein
MITMMQSVCFYLRSTLEVLSDQFKDQYNETTSLDDWYTRKIGRVNANRISQEFIDDAKAKAMSMNFEQSRTLSESFYRCKDKGNDKIYISIVLHDFFLLSIVGKCDNLFENN